MITDLYWIGQEKREEIESYIRQSKLPKIQTGKLITLNTPVNFSEVSEAINNAKIGKSSGPDGLRPNIIISYRSW